MFKYLLMSRVNATCPAHFICFGLIVRWNTVCELLCCSKSCSQATSTRMMLDVLTDMNMNYEHFKLKQLWGHSGPIYTSAIHTAGITEKVAVSSDLLPLKWFIITVLARLLPASAFTLSLPTKHAERPDNWPLSWLALLFVDTKKMDTIRPWAQ